MAGLDDLVVDVGEVLDMLHLVAGEFQVAPHNVDAHEQPGVADVRMVLGRQPADVHRHGIAVRLKWLLATGEGVKKLDRHVALRTSRLRAAPGALPAPRSAPAAAPRPAARDQAYRSSRGRWRGWWCAARFGPPHGQARPPRSSSAARSAARPRSLRSSSPRPR